MTASTSNDHVGNELSATGDVPPRGVTAGRVFGFAVGRV